MLIHPHQPAATGAKNAWIIRPSNIASDIAKDITPPNMAKENITPDYPFSNIIPSNIARNITSDDPLAVLSFGGVVYFVSGKTNS